MRTIKFKAKMLKADEWIVGDFVCINGVTCIKPEGESDNVFPICTKVVPDTVCQFTGFLDKNGNEIYEGDVLRSDEYPYSCLEDGVRDNYYAVVYYCEEGSCFGTVTAKNPSSDVGGISDGILDDVEREKMKSFEVIGNVHDPEWKQYREYIQDEEKEQYP